MARRQVVEIKCDRCQRVENQENTSVPAGVEDELSVTFQGRTIKYHDLCKRCREACANYFKSLTKQPEDEKKAPAAPTTEKSGFLGLGGGKKG